MADAVLLLDVGRLGTLACKAIRTYHKTSLGQISSPTRTSTGRPHENQAHMFGSRLGLRATGETTLEVLNASLELADRGLEPRDHIICNGSHCGVLKGGKRER